MKSILHVALIAPGGYTSKPFISAFLNNGFSEYHVFDFQKKVYNADKEAMRRELIQEAERLKPDMIFMQIQSSDILDVETFRRLSQISFTVNYTFDIRTPEQTEWMYNIAPIVGLVCFSNQRDVNECNRRGYSNVMVLQSSADMDIYRPSEMKMSRNGIVFIGNNFENTSHQFPGSVERAGMVEFLKKYFPDNFSVYGKNWEGSALLNPADEVKVLQASLIAINQNNFHEDMYSSDRIWRTMATGALCLTKHFDGIEKIFTIGEHLDCWNSYDELSDKIHHYVDNPFLAEDIAANGMSLVRGRHTWWARVNEMMNFVYELKLLMDYVYKKAPDINACTKSGAHVIDGAIPGPFDERYNNLVCDCGKLKWVWAECGCTLKEWQLRAQENI